MTGNILLGGDALEHLHLFLVVIGVATFAVARQVLEFSLVQRMFDGEVAIQAIDLVFADVLVVHELQFFFVHVSDRGQIVLAVVANQAPLGRDFARAADHVAVAVLAVHAFAVSEFVRELHAAAQIEFLLGNLVAVRASARPSLKC